MTSVEKPLRSEIEIVEGLPSRSSRKAVRASHPAGRTQRMGLMQQSGVRSSAGRRRGIDQWRGFVAGRGPVGTGKPHHALGGTGRCVWVCVRIAWADKAHMAMLSA